MQKEKSNLNKNVTNKGDDVYELDSEDNGDVDKNDDDKVNDDAGKNDEGDHDSDNADENEKDAHECDDADNNEKDGHKSDDVDKNEEEDHESNDADNNEENSNGNNDEDDNQEDVDDSDEENWDHLNYQIHKKDDPGMRELKDGIYINRKIYDNAKKTKSTKPTHLIRRLMDGVFIQSEVLNCTLTGNPGRNKRQNEDECEMLHPLAVAAIISKATSLYKKARPNKMFISTKSIHETISQKLYEMKVKGRREKDGNRNQ
ncbi:protein PFC0760c-like [Chelonus insularis]|uniref:protein PFC0760c-like n=1 Tax=Chelonus insularis TaxID=460826 RepID=UPI00158E9B16|nr:protein PFC0760c-like [Chelonus insularis]